MTLFARPRAIAESDVCADFDCGETTLNDWLRSRAVTNEKAGASRTFVSIERESGVVAGYYCLSASALVRGEAAPRLRRNMPDPIPVVLIGRLAVDRRFARNGLGVSLLKDAVTKAIEASRLIGSRAVIVETVNARAEDFYRPFGFDLIPGGSGAMYLLTRDAEATVAAL